MGTYICTALRTFDCLKEFVSCGLQFVVTDAVEHLLNDFVSEAVIEHTCTGILIHYFLTGLVNNFVFAVFIMLDDT